MGEVIPLPPRPQIVVRYATLKHYGDVEGYGLILAREGDGASGMLAMILDGLGPEIGFEVIYRVHNSAEGMVVADHIASAVLMALRHTTG